MASEDASTGLRAAVVAGTASAGLRLRSPSVAEHLILGVATLGCMYRDVPDEEARATLFTALQAGIHRIDVAPAYGCGLAESRLGDLLREYSEAAAEPIQVSVSTKCGYVVRRKDDADPQRVEGMDDTTFCHHKYFPQAELCFCWDYRAEGIRQSVADSLQRLQLPSVHVLRLHSPESDAKLSEAAACDAVGVMAALAAEGMTDQISLGMNKASWTHKILDVDGWAAQIDSIMLAGEWNLLNQQGYQLLLRCQQLGKAVINAEIFCSGALWGLPFYDHSPITEEVTERISQWRTLITEFNDTTDFGDRRLTLAELSLHFALLPSCVEQVCVGMAGEDQVRANLELFEVERSSSELQAIGALFGRAQSYGLLRPDIALDVISQSLHESV